jgi:hypothetical protein
MEVILGYLAFFYYEESQGLHYIVAAGPRQHSHSRIRPVINMIIFSRSRLRFANLEGKVRVLISPRIW